MDSHVVSYISLCTALIATIAGPYVSIKTARSQINANVISTNRIKRMETVRELISGVIAQLITYLVLREQIDQQYKGNISNHAELVSRFEKGVHSVTVLSLLLNPNDRDNQRIVESLEWSMNRVLSNDDHATVRQEVEGRMTEVIGLSQSILKREWNRVKRGD